MDYPLWTVAQWRLKDFCLDPWVEVDCTCSIVSTTNNNVTFDLKYPARPCISLETGMETDWKLVFSSFVLKSELYTKSRWNAGCKTFEKNHWIFIWLKQDNSVDVLFFLNFRPPYIPSTKIEFVLFRTLIAICRWMQISGSMNEWNWSEYWKVEDDACVGLELET